MRINKNPEAVAKAVTKTMPRVLTILLTTVLAILLVAMVSSIFSGCISSVRKEYFQLHLAPAPGAPVAELAGPLSGRILMVEKARVDDIYNDYRLVYRLSPFQLAYYSYKFWIELPEKLVRDSMADYLTYSGRFKRVVRGYAGNKPDLRLRSVVYALEEYDRADDWFAHLEMEIIVEDVKTGEQLLSHSFNRSRRLPRKEAVELPGAISIILRQELDRVITDLEKLIIN